ncbi:MAG TPA: hypothetical protein VGM83_19785 [Devosiaceae bacterium]
MTEANLDDVVLEGFEDDGVFPNSRLPTLIYRQALPMAATSPEALEALFAANGWPPQWRAGIYAFHHYHSTTHEALGIAAGSATVMVGGPDGRAFDVGQGDVILLPAGTAHRRLAASPDFLVVGAYPPGANWDVLKGEPGERERALENIARVPMPTSDPVGGKPGPLMKVWK